MKNLNSEDELLQDLRKEMQKRTSLLAAIVTKDCKQILSQCTKCGYFGEMPLLDTKGAKRILCTACITVQRYKPADSARPNVGGKE